MKFRILNPETLPVNIEADSREDAWKTLQAWMDDTCELADEGEDKISAIYNEKEGGETLD